MGAETGGIVHYSSAPPKSCDLIIVSESYCFQKVMGERSFKGNNKDAELKKFKKNKKSRLFSGCFREPERLGLLVFVSFLTYEQER